MLLPYRSSYLYSRASETKRNGRGPPSFVLNLFLVLLFRPGVFEAKEHRATYEAKPVRYTTPPLIQVVGKAGLDKNSEKKK